MTTLNINDVVNLLKLLSRSQFNGMEEAEVGVVLKQKLQTIAQELQAPPADPADEDNSVDEEDAADGGDVSTAD